MEAKKFIVVLGGGESGTGAALLARHHQMKVFLSDLGKIKDSYKEELQEAGIDFEEGQHHKAKILEADLVVKSPGIPDTAPLVKAILEKEIEVISEIEFASRFYKGKVIAITGSNGKTTTTRLIHHLMKKAGMDVGLGGNIGTSFARQLCSKHPAQFVLEVSSFQLDGIQSFRPDIAILLNITADHLDRYNYQMANYAAAKFRIAMNQTEKDLLILNAGDAETNNRLNDFSLKAKIEMVDFPPEQEGGNYQIGNFKYNESDLTIQGKHNLFNANVALRACLKAGADPNKLIEGLRSFENDPHRLEPVAEIEGVKFINDSKATNVDAVYFALDAMKTPVVWIAGGTDKGNDYQAIESLVKNKVKALVCLGADNRKLKEAFGQILETIKETTTAVDAVDLAFSLAKPGDTVLLSPACASFDLFKNYMDRGAQFKNAVVTLKQKNDSN